MIRSFRFRLEPTADQREAFGQIASACRFVYNLALEQRRDWWQQYRANTGRAISYIGQTYELTALRAETDWLAATPRDALDEALRAGGMAFGSIRALRPRHFVVVSPH